MAPTNLYVPPFEDRNAYNATTTLVATNEEPEVFNLLLGRKRFANAGGISSSGDMLLSVVAPRSDSVLAIDHSYGSLCAAFSRVILFQLVEPKQLLDLLFYRSYSDFEQVLKRVWDYVPEILKKNHASYHDAYNNPLQQYYTHWTDVRRELCLLKPNTFYRIPKHLHKISFVHGDLSDLGAPLDLLYISNAIEHQNRYRKSYTLDDFAPFVKPNGLILYTSNNYNPRAPKPTLANGSKCFEDVANLQGFRTSWAHCVARRKS